jgi:hypothetical protein
MIQLTSLRFFSFVTLLSLSCVSGACGGQATSGTPTGGGNGTATSPSSAGNPTCTLAGSTWECPPEYGGSRPACPADPQVGTPCDLDAGGCFACSEGAGIDYVCARGSGGAGSVWRSIGAEIACQ